MACNIDPKSKEDGKKDMKSDSQFDGKFFKQYVLM